MSDQMVKLKMALASDRYLALGVDDGTNEDADNRFELQADGQMLWGDGTNAQDLVLKRLSAGVLDLTTGVFANHGVQLAASFTEINRNCQVASRLVAASGSLTLTANSHEGKIIELNSLTGSVVTLPAATGSGAVFRFIISVLATSNSHKIQVANSSDIIQGLIFTLSDNSQAVLAYAAGASDDTITLNRTTTGCTVRGEYIEIVDAAANLFLVRGFTASTGTEATPFSSAV